MNKKLILTLCLLPLGLFQTGDAWAFPFILGEWQTEYPNSTSDDKAKCQLCHQSKNGGEPWNDYGWEIRSRYISNRTNANLLAAFRDAEAVNSDSDPTGSTNLTEIKANTLPGWTPGDVNTIHFENGTSTDQSPPSELEPTLLLDPLIIPNVVISPNLIDFGQVKIRTLSDAQEVQITNTGLADLVITEGAINYCNGASTEFTFQFSDYDSAIKTGDARVLTISFMPENPDERAGCIEISGTGANTAIVDFTGEGVRKVRGGGGGPGGGKLSVVTELSDESHVDDRAQRLEVLTYKTTIHNGGKKEVFINVTEIVPSATVATGGGDFDCSPGSVEGSRCEALNILVPGKDVDTGAGVGNTELFFDVLVEGVLVPALTPIVNTIEATSVDCTASSNICTATTAALPDNDAPELLVQSHANGAIVGDSGFTLSGIAMDDDSGIDASGVSVHDGSFSHTASYDSDDDSWVVPLPAYPSGDDVTLTVTATDFSGNSAVSAITVHVQPSVALNARHLFNRISYGITPSELEDLNDGFSQADLNNYLTAQLNSTGCLEPSVAQAKDKIDPDTLLVVAEGIFDEPGKLLTLPIANLTNLSNYAILMSAYNPCQLREVLTQFWRNHFNTRFSSVKSKAGATDLQTTIWELAEYDALRTNALGNFGNLVKISARSPAMLYYLDGVTNTALAPNENYGRELMELHTLSVNGGYTSQDVENVAVAFTGWAANANGDFMCDVADHSTDDITLDLGPLYIGPNTISEASCEGAGLAVIDQLVRHPSTGEFICEKLTELLVSDQITPDIVMACADEFALTVNDLQQIAKVVRIILEHIEFTQATDYLDKVKTPLELTAGYLRNFDILNSDLVPPLTGDLDQLSSKVSAMGMTLFQFSTPDGFPEQSIDWVNSGLMQRRFAFISDMAFNTNSTNGIYLNLNPDPADPDSFFNALGLTTADEIVDYLMAMALQGRNTVFERAQALAILNQGGNFELDIVSVKENKLRILFAVVLNNPTYQYQ